MKICFLLGSPDISGGSYVIFQHALNLKVFGHEVTILTEDTISLDRLFWIPEAKSLLWGTPETKHAENFDVVIATWWKTVYWAGKVNAKKYVYFVQSIESRFYPDLEKPLRKLVESTYCLPFYFITEATWIQAYLREVHLCQCLLVKNGIQKEVFTVDGPAFAQREHNKLRVLVEGALGVPFKNVARTIELVRKSLADDIWLLTPTQVDNYPGVSRVFSKIPFKSTPEVYRSCDVIVKLSYVEGMFGPPLEMFHCGGTAIVYNVSGHDEYIQNDINGLVIKNDDEAGVITAINSLKKDNGVLNRLKAGALRTSAEWPDWQKSSRDFEGALEAINSSIGLMSQQALAKMANFYFDWYVIAEQYKLKVGRASASLSKGKMIIKKLLAKVRLFGH